MSESKRTEVLLEAVLKTLGAGQTIILDAAALTCARSLRDVAPAHPPGAIMTPPYGEMSRLTGIDFDTIAHGPAAIAQRIADELLSQR